MPSSFTIANNLLNTIGDSLRRAAAEVVKETAEELRDTAVGLAPVRTGALRDSIRIEPENELNTSVGEGSEEVNYAKFVEFGTSRQSAQPHFTPACETARVYFEREIANLERRIK